MLEVSKYLFEYIEYLTRAVKYSLLIWWLTASMGRTQTQTQVLWISPSSGQSGMSGSRRRWCWPKSWYCSPSAFHACRHLSAEKRDVKDLSVQFKTRREPSWLRSAACRKRSGDTGCRNLNGGKTQFHRTWKQIFAQIYEQFSFLLAICVNIPMSSICVAPSARCSASWVLSEEFLLFFSCHWQSGPFWVSKHR